MPERSVDIGASVGLHARPAALFVQAVTESQLPVRISRGDGQSVDGRSILAVMGLGVKNGETVTLSVDGEGSEDVLDSLVALLARDLDSQ